MSNLNVKIGETYQGFWKVLVVLGVIIVLSCNPKYRSVQYPEELFVPLNRFPVNLISDTLESRLDIIFTSSKNFSINKRPQDWIYDMIYHDSTEIMGFNKKRREQRCCFKLLIVRNCIESTKSEFLIIPSSIQHRKNERNPWENRSISHLYDKCSDIAELINNKIRSME